MVSAAMLVQLMQVIRNLYRAQVGMLDLMGYGEIPKGDYNPSDFQQGGLGDEKIMDWKFRTLLRSMMWTLDAGQANRNR